MRQRTAKADPPAQHGNVVLQQRSRLPYRSQMGNLPLFKTAACASLVLGLIYHISMGGLERPIRERHLEEQGPVKAYPQSKIKGASSKGNSDAPVERELFLRNRRSTSGNGFARKGGGDFLGSIIGSGAGDGSLLDSIGDGSLLENIGGDGSILDSVLNNAGDGEGGFLDSIFGEDGLVNVNLDVQIAGQDLEDIIGTDLEGAIAVGKEVFDRIRDAVPSLPCFQTEAPSTMSPSVSMAPSMSPSVSMAPSIAPTIAPSTGTQTTSPTVSSAPSTNPSISPSAVPSEAPSSMPSVGSNIIADVPKKRRRPNFDEIRPDVVEKFHAWGADHGFRP